MKEQLHPWLMLLSTQSSALRLVVSSRRGATVSFNLSSFGSVQPRGPGGTVRPARCGAVSGYRAASPRPSVSPVCPVWRRRSADSFVPQLTASPPSPAGPSSRLGVSIVLSLRRWSNRNTATRLPTHQASGQAGFSGPPARRRRQPPSSVHTTEITSHWTFDGF